MVSTLILSKIESKVDRVQVENRLNFTYTQFGLSWSAYLGAASCKQLVQVNSFFSSYSVSFFRSFMRRSSIL